MRLKEIRIQKNISQYDLAASCGVSQSSIAGYENGRCTPNPDTLLKISVALGCSIEEILKDPKEESDGRIDADQGQDLVSEDHEDSNQAAA